MKGNVDIKTPSHLRLRPYLVAKRIRVRPYSDQEVFVCLRIEIYGCNYEGEPPGTPPGLVPEPLPPSLARPS